MNQLTGIYLVKGNSIFLNICLKGNVAERYAFGTINKEEMKLFFPDKVEERRYIVYDIKEMKEHRRKAK